MLKRPTTYQTEKKEGETGTSSVSASLLLFQTRCRFDYAVLRARSPRQVVTPGDGGTGQLFAATSLMIFSISSTPFSINWILSDFWLRLGIVKMSFPSALGLHINWNLLNS